MSTVQPTKNVCPAIFIVDNVGGAGVVPNAGNGVTQVPPNMGLPYQNTIGASMPLHPDVHLKKLPFYDVLETLIKPSSLFHRNNEAMQKINFYFTLNPQQVTQIATSRDILNDSEFEHSIQVQLRFCLFESSCEQEDCFPSNIIVKVNNKLCPLPNPIPTNRPTEKPKRPGRPVNVTSNVLLLPTVKNTITIQWCPDNLQSYCIAAYLVRKLTSSQLLDRIKSKGIKPADYTRDLIKEKLKEDTDSEIATTMLKVSLNCALSKIKMSIPCRASTCSHFQCFDANFYLQMNELNAKWNCPVCDKPAIYDNLVIDGYFQEVLASSSLKSEDTEIQLHKDGSWSAYNLKNEIQLNKTAFKPVAKVIVLEMEKNNSEVCGTNLPNQNMDIKPPLSTMKTENPSESVLKIAKTDAEEYKLLEKAAPTAKVNKIAIQPMIPMERVLNQNPSSSGGLMNPDMCADISEPLIEEVRSLNSTTCTDVHRPLIKSVYFTDTLEPSKLCMVSNSTAGQQFNENTCAPPSSANIVKVEEPEENSPKPACRKAKTNAEYCRMYRLRKKAAEEANAKGVKNRKEKKQTIKTVVNQNPSSSSDEAFLNPDSCADISGPLIQSVCTLNPEVCADIPGPLILSVYSKSIMAPNSIEEHVNESICIPPSPITLSQVDVHVENSPKPDKRTKTNADYCWEYRCRKKDAEEAKAANYNLSTKIVEVEIGDNTSKPPFKKAKTNAETCRQYRLRKKAAEEANVQNKSAKKTTTIDSDDLDAAELLMSPNYFAEQAEKNTCVSSSSITVVKFEKHEENSIKPPFKKAKSNAENCRQYRMRKKLENQLKLKKKECE